MDFDLLIQNGMVALPQGMFETCDIAVVGGKIAAIERRGVFPETARAVDATGLHVLPGIIDAHVHFRDPGFEYKEDFATGTTAAAAGGVTTVVDMPNNDPVCNDVRRFKEKLHRISRRAYVDYGLMVAVTEETSDQVPELCEIGCNAFKIYMGATVGGVPSPDDSGMLKAFQCIRETGLRIAVHAENNAIIQKFTAKVKNEGRTDPLAHVMARPSAAEAEDVKKAIALTRRTGAKLHICHLSSREGVELVREARARGMDVTAETTPHYLLLDESHMKLVGGIQKVNPPVRSRDHAEAIWQGVLDGTVGGIATDHAPHTREEKTNENIWKVISGFVGVETSVPLMLTQVNEGRLSLETYVKLAAENPAKFFNLYPRKGVVAVGSDADFTIVDMHKEGRIDSDRLHSRSRVTPFDGWKVKGGPVHTIVRGNLVMKNGKICGQPMGKHVRAIV